MLKLNGFDQNITKVPFFLTEYPKNVDFVRFVRKDFILKRNHYSIIEFYICLIRTNKKINRRFGEKSICTQQIIISTALKTTVIQSLPNIHERFMCMHVCLYVFDFICRSRFWETISAHDGRVSGAGSTMHTISTSQASIIESKKFTFIVHTSTHFYFIFFFLLSLLCFIDFNTNYHI